MAFSEDLLAQRNKLQHEILALENSLGHGSNPADVLSSDCDSAEESDDSGHAGEDAAHGELETERQQIQKEIEELEKMLGADAALVDALTDSEQGSVMESNGEDSDEDLDLPQDLETCLQLNLVYQEVLIEKLADLERLLKENREQQKELEEQLSGPSYINPGLPHLRLFLGSFMKPYFKDKLTGLGPQSNEETKERLANGTKTCDEMKIRRWEPWQKTLLVNSVVTDTMKRMLQPKLSKMEYLNAKLSKAEEAEKEGIRNQITLLEKDITEIRSMKQDQLYGRCHDDHDWDKISNVDFEGLRQPDDLMRFWQNYLHPSINKSVWSQDEIAKLEDVVEEYKCCHWEQIAESLGTNRSAFMCFQIYQRYISKRFRKREWTKEEDQVFRELVDKMRIGNFIPYTQISYFMEGRDSSQLNYRWTCVLDPSIKKGPWSKEEDQLLLKAVKKYGCKDWWKMRLEVPGRTDNACRDRYMDCLHEDKKRGAWSEDEVELLKKLVAKHGVGKWSKIAAEIPNRVDSQCLHKWNGIVKLAARNGVKRVRRKTSAKQEPQPKRRRVRRKRLEKDDEFDTQSDTSEDKEVQVPYMDSDGAEAEENVPSVENCRLEYVQPDMKEWIPVRGNKLPHSSRNLRTILVRLPTEAEEGASGDVRNTVLDALGKPVKTYIGMEPPALGTWNSSNEHAMIMVSECDVKCLLTSMRASAMKMKTAKIKTSLPSHTMEDKSTKERGQKKGCKPITKAVTTTQLSYDLMLAIIPWIGNVIMPLPLHKRRDCEADIVRKRAADVPLLKSPVFLLFLQALKIDADGCKKVIEAQRNKVSLTPRPAARPKSDKKRAPGSIQVTTVADELAERKKSKKHSRSLQSPEFVEFLLLPQSAKIAIPRRTRQPRNAKQVMQSTVIHPQTVVVTQPDTDKKVGSSINVVQGDLPLLKLGTQNASKVPQCVSNLALPAESGKVTQPPSCPTTSTVSSTGPHTEALEKVSITKRKQKPTVKAQALMHDKNTKLSKKQAAKKQQNSNGTMTAAVLPQTTAWILTPAGLMPVAEIQVQAPAIPNNIQMLFQSPAIVNQSSCVALSNAMSPNNPTPDLPINNIRFLIDRSNLGQNPRPLSISDSIVSSLSTSSDLPSVISATVNAPQVLPDANLPTAITGSTSQISASKTTCNQNKAVTPVNPRSTLVPVLSHPMETSQKLIPSCISDSTKSVPNVSSVTAVTDIPVASVHPFNISGPGTISHPQSQSMPQPGFHMVFQQPFIVNQNGSLAFINTAGPSLPNASPAAAAQDNMVPTNSTASNISKSLSISSTEGSLTLVNVTEPCLLKNVPPTAMANGTRVPPNSEAPNISKSHPTFSKEGPVVSLAYSQIPTSVPSALTGTSHVIPQFSFVNSPVTVNVGGFPIDQLCVNQPISPMTPSFQILSQTVTQQVAAQPATEQSVQTCATTSNPRPKQMTFDPSLIFEQPDQVKKWIKGNGGIALPDLKDNMPYLPPFVSSISTLTDLLKGRDSLLKSAAQLLPEEQRHNSEEAKIAAVRKMVSERFKTNQAYLLLKARFLSCFTLPALLATINPHIELPDALGQEDNMDKAKPTRCGKDELLKPVGSLLTMKERKVAATQFPGREPRKQVDSPMNA